ncbi:MAG: hypothetical protein MZV70_19375 [Desulfobacterales bacterium]|nr:hypothetical protein [Desulfobacterales bacterium]
MTAPNSTKSSRAATSATRTRSSPTSSPSRTPPERPRFSRILRHPPHRTEVHLPHPLHPEGIAPLIVRAHDKPTFRLARKSDWGARWTPPAASETED